MTYGFEAFSRDCGGLTAVPGRKGQESVSMFKRLLKNPVEHLSSPFILKECLPAPFTLKAAGNNTWLEVMLTAARRKDRLAMEDGRAWTPESWLFGIVGRIPGEHEGRLIAGVMTVDSETRGQELRYAARLIYCLTKEIAALPALAKDFGISKGPKGEWDSEVLDGRLEIMGRFGFMESSAFRWMMDNHKRKAVLIWPFQTELVRGGCKYQWSTGLRLRGMMQDLLRFGRAETDESVRGLLDDYDRRPFRLPPCRRAFTLRNETAEGEFVFEKVVNP